MNPLSPPSITAASSAANQVPPSVTKQSELSLEEQIEKGERALTALKIKKQQQDLAALYHLQHQQTPQRTNNILDTDLSAVTTNLPPPTTTTTTKTKTKTKTTTSTPPSPTSSSSSPSPSASSSSSQPPPPPPPPHPPSTSPSPSPSPSSTATTTTVNNTKTLSDLLSNEGSTQLEQTTTSTQPETVRHAQSCDGDIDEDGTSIVATGIVTVELSSLVRSKRTKNPATDLREQKEVRSAVTTTTPTHDRSVVRNDVVDDNHYLDPRQALADTNDRKTAVPDRKSRHEKPMYYDIGQKTLGYKEFCGRIIPASDLYNVVSNYAYALFGVGTLCSGGSTHRGRVRHYTCACCNLKIRFDRQTNVDSEDTFFVLDVDSFPRRFLDRTHGGTSPIVSYVPNQNQH